MNTLKQIKNKVMILGWYQLIGGILGITLSIDLLFNILSQGPDGSIILMLLINIPFVLSIYAGYACIKDQTNRFLISKINQAFQVVSFSIAGAAYTYYSGVFFSIGIDTTLNSTYDFRLGLSAFNFEFNSGSDNYMVYVNLVAFYILLKTMKYENLMEGENEKIVNSEYLDDHFTSQ